MERLQKVLAQAGIASRRKSEQLILQGRVAVNDQVVTQLGFKVDCSKDKITVDGKPLPAIEQKVYLLLNKPPGYVTTVRDQFGRKTVIDLLRGVNERVFPVGRLDYDTAGLLLLTNDGELAYKLTHPRHQINKKYLAKVQGIPQQEKIINLRKGVLLEDGMTAPAWVRMVGKVDGNALLEITIHEGRNRQVRRMCEAVGHPVIQLTRIEFAGLTAGNLPQGKYRTLTQNEVKMLQDLARGTRLGIKQMSRGRGGFSEKRS